MPVEFVDADAHVVEGQALIGECMRRWPHAFSFSPRNELLTEGRRYPEPEGPGAGCPPEHGLSTVDGINPWTPEGTLADADRDGIDRMVFFPSFGLRAPSIETREVAVFDRHPRLRVAFLEAGVGWVPYFVDRMHEHWEKRGDWVRNGWRKDPRRYVEAGNVWVSCEPEETILPAVADALGPDFIMYASDYPHWDSDWPESTRPLRERADLSDDVRAKIAGGNARRFYQLA